MAPEALADCGGCHACCTKAGSPPFRNDAERAGLPADLRAELAAYYASVTNSTELSREAASLRCLWLTVQGTCLHYEHRPPTCRDFMVGSDQCVEFIELGVGVPDAPWPQDPRGG